MGSKAIDTGITPLHIAIALQYFKSINSGAVEYSGCDSDVASQICHEFADAGLLEIADDNTHWKATNKMRHYVAALCEVPFPVKQAEIPLDMVSHLDAVLNKGGKSVGDSTMRTRNAVISSVIDEYLATTPRARF